MTRTISALVMVAVFCLLVSSAVMAQAADPAGKAETAKPQPAVAPKGQAAPAAEEPQAKADGTAAPAAEAAKPAEGEPGKEAEKPKDEFHFNFSDLKDLRDADIKLPDVGGPAEGEGQPAKAEGKEGQEGEENDEPELDPAEVAKAIIDGMGNSTERLAKMTDPGQETQGVQKKVVDDLSALIKWVAQQQQQSQSQSKSQSQQKDSQKAQGQGKGQGQSKSRGQGQKPSRGQQAMKDSQATHGSVQEGDLEQVARLLNESWGSLPFSPSRETMQSVPEMILEKYRPLLNSYYYALARQKSESGSSNSSGGGN